MKFDGRTWEEMVTDVAIKLQAKRNYSILLRKVLVALNSIGDKTVYPDADDSFTLHDLASEIESVMRTYGDEPYTELERGV